MALMNAMAAVDNGTSIRKAAEMYGIPRSTLHDHVSGRIKYGARSGPSPYLTTEEEEELASFLLQSAKIGYPHTKSQVFAIVQQIIDGKGIKSNLSNGWWERFCARHPNIPLNSFVHSWSRSVVPPKVLEDSMGHSMVTPEKSKHGIIPLRTATSISSVLQKPITNSLPTSKESSTKKCGMVLTNHKNFDRKEKRKQEEEEKKLQRKGDRTEVELKKKNAESKQEMRDQQKHG